MFILAAFSANSFPINKLYIQLKHGKNHNQNLGKVPHYSLVTKKSTAAHQACMAFQGHPLLLPPLIAEFPAFFLGECAQEGRLGLSIHSPPVFIENISHTRIFNKKIMVAQKL